MADILRGLVSGSSTFVFGWVAPSLLAVVAFAFFLFPEVKHLPVLRDISDLSTGLQTTVLLSTMAFVALLMNAFSTPLYRVLEGYLAWPKWLQELRIAKQRSRKKALADEAEKATGWRQGLLYERLQRYPAPDLEIAPTSLGNAIRSFETYGTDRFNLDALFFWPELFTLISEGLRNEYEQSRAAVDFFVSALYLSSLVGVAAITVAITQGAPSAFVVAAVSFILVPLTYRLALQSTNYWGQTTRAIVNLGRKPLAESLSLILPAELEEEREMWGAVNAFFFYEYDDKWASELNRFRVSSPQKPGTK